MESSPLHLHSPLSPTHKQSQFVFVSKIPENLWLTNEKEEKTHKPLRYDIFICKLNPAKAYCYKENTQDYKCANMPVDTIIQPRASLSINALCASVYIYIRQLSRRYGKYRSDCRYSPYSNTLFLSLY